MLVPYFRRNSMLFDPFREWEEAERSFFPEQSAAAFQTDIVDQGDGYELDADLPGFRKEDIHVELKGDRLTIQAERNSEHEEKDKKGSFVRCERSYGKFTRSFGVEGIDTAAIRIRYEDGVLKLFLPKIMQTQPESRQLEIE